MIHFDRHSLLLLLPVSHHIHSYQISLLDPDSKRTKPQVLHWNLPVVVERSNRRSDHLGRKRDSETHCASQAEEFLQHCSSGESCCLLPSDPGGQASDVNKLPASCNWSCTVRVRTELRNVLVLIRAARSSHPQISNLSPARLVRCTSLQRAVFEMLVRSITPFARLTVSTKRTSLLFHRTAIFDASLAPSPSAQSPTSPSEAEPQQESGKSRWKMNSLTESVLGTLAGIVLLSTAGVGYHHWVGLTYLSNFNSAPEFYSFSSLPTCSTKKKSCAR